MSKEFSKIIEDFIVDELYANGGMTFYGSELAMDLTSEINVNGNYNNMSYKEALDFVFEHSDEASETFEYYVDMYDMKPNVFESPNKYVVLMIIYGVENILTSSETVNELWNVETELTEDVIKKILNDLDIKEK